MVFQQTIDFPFIQVYFEKLVDEFLNAAITTLENIASTFFNPKGMTVYW
jgi:hypothetical protein